MAEMENGLVRDLFNALRTGDHGVSLDALLRPMYFLQHRRFTLFDAKEAFHSSTGASDRYLRYHDFQHAVAKIARCKYNTMENDAKPPSDLELTSKLMAEINALESIPLDPLQRQLTTGSVVGMLDTYSAKLTQSFNLYGKESALAVFDTSSTITLDGFVDFLNAYFEYEEFLSYQTIQKMFASVKAAFMQASLNPSSPSTEMMFAEFLELLCRVASEFHHQVLIREGAQLRRAIESCRLEFSVELLMQHMNITLMRVDLPVTCAPAVSNPVNLSGLEELSLEGINPISVSAAEEESRTFDSLIQDIQRLLDDFERVNGAPKRPKRTQSVLFARLPPRKSQSNCLGPPTRPQITHCAEKLPQVALIREVIIPPPLPSAILKCVENVMTYQNLAQYHMALGALDTCKVRYKEYSSNANQPEAIEVLLFFTLLTASVYDSARRDFRALSMHFDALALSDQLPLDHPGRALTKSCLGCILFYIGETALARQCHLQVLDARKDSAWLGEDHIDTATAMNNLACCLSQDPVGSSMEEAYLLMKQAKRIYTDTFSAAHPRAEIILRNLDRVQACLSSIVVDPLGAVARGEYAHVIPGSRFQIRALVPVVAATGKADTKKKKKKGGVKKKKK